MKWRSVSSKWTTVKLNWSVLKSSSYGWQSISRGEWESKSPQLEPTSTDNPPVFPEVTESEQNIDYGFWPKNLFHCAKLRTATKLYIQSFAVFTRRKFYVEIKSLVMGFLAKYLENISPLFFQFPKQFVGRYWVCSKAGNKSRKNAKKPEKVLALGCISCRDSEILVAKNCPNIHLQHPRSESNKFVYKAKVRTKEKYGNKLGWTSAGWTYFVRVACRPVGAQNTNFEKMFHSRKTSWLTSVHYTSKGSTYRTSSVSSWISASRSLFSLKNSPYQVVGEIRPEMRMNCLVSAQPPLHRCFGHENIKVMVYGCFNHRGPEVRVWDAGCRLHRLRVQAQVMVFQVPFLTHLRRRPALFMHAIDYLQQHCIWVGLSFFPGVKKFNVTYR